MQEWIDWLYIVGVTIAFLVFFIWNYARSRRKPTKKSFREGFEQKMKNKKKHF